MVGAIRLAHARNRLAGMFTVTDSWAGLYEARKAMQRRFGNIYRLPLRRRVHELIVPHVGPGVRLLDVGASRRDLAARLARAGAAGVCVETLEPDPGAPADHAGWDAVQGPFEVITMLEVLEHVPFDALAALLARARSHLAPGGALVVSTPNVYHPVEYSRDATHCTPLCWDQLAGVIELAGFRVNDVARCFHDGLLGRIAKRYLFGWLFRLLGVDYARQVVVVANPRCVRPRLDAGCR